MRIKGTMALLGAVGMLAATSMLFAGGQKEGSAAGTQSAATAPASASGVELLGSGASFPFPIYSKMFDEYNKAVGTKVNYQSIGSSGGVKNIQNKVVDFGASDAYLSDDQMHSFDAPVVHIPTVLGSIVVIYNLPGNPSLRLTGEVVADVFMGKITKWNDPAIAGLNPGTALPAQEIIVAHRSDGSGTTFNFTYYLSKVSGAWSKGVGNANSVNWPVGLGGAQNAGVAGIVKQTVGSIGYVELAYALQNKLPYATLRNQAGNWITPSLDSTSAAASGAMPSDTRVYLGNTGAANGYPIANLTWIIVYKEQSYGKRSPEQAKALVKLLWWMTHDGEKYTKDLLYAPLPDAAVKSVEAILGSITYGGKPVLAL